MTNSESNIKKYVAENNLENYENIKIKDYIHALKLTPNDPNIYNNLGILLIKLHKYQEAITCFKKAIKINSNFETAHNNLGNAYQELGKYQEAISCYQRAISIKPN